MSVESDLYRIKQWYWMNWRLCLFCNHKVPEGEAQLAHIIRRSFSTRYLTEKLNTGLAHLDCHTIFDNEPEQAIYLPRFMEVMFIGYILDPDWCAAQMLVYPADYPDFEKIANETGLHLTLQHHGELLILPDI